jgi:DNA mismatch repair ATPase MutS
MRREGYSFEVPPRDEAGSRALSELQDRGINGVANAAAQATDHLLAFFGMLRTDLAFYVGCINLHEALSSKGEPTCFPAVAPRADAALSGRGLYDVCLTPHLAERAVGNEVKASGKRLVMITGANQGGKSTFLRGLGVAQLMMQAGMFVGAEAFEASVADGVFTHYRREEDETMKRGKFDEELARMSAIADRIRPDGMLLCNESFAATNEQEGSEIAGGVVRALTEAGVRVVFVTHLYELAHGLYEGGLEDGLFLRAERLPDGRRTFRLLEGEPLPTSYGADSFKRVFGASPGARPVAAPAGG